MQPFYQAAENDFLSGLTGATERWCIILQTRKRLKDAAKQKPRFLLCVAEKVPDGLFQRTAKYQ